MEFLRGRTSLLITLVAVGALCSLSPVPSRGQARGPDAGKGRKSKVIIYPKAGETIEQLKARGLGKVANYGSYWVVTGTDQQINALRKAYGNRVDRAEHLNRIELAAYPIDTTEGEPAVPDNLRETETAGKRLRLIQFVGPVQPQWLEQVKAAGDVKVVNYVPHNAYLLWLDGGAEAKLRKLMEPDGPIQWIGAYHPYYKIPKHLRTNETPGGSPTIDVVVGLVEHEGTEQTIQNLSRFGFVQRSDSVAGQRQVTLTIARGFLAALAQLPDVLWVDKIEPKVLLDEVQGLITVTFTNNIPGNGPFPPLPSPPGTNYLQWLTDTVGGGLLSFTNPAAYPIVDIADTGFGNEHRQEFNVLGDPFGLSRVVYDVTYADCGFVGSGNNSVDLYGHGTVIATILAGFDTNVSEVVTCIYNRVELRTFRSSTNTCIGTGNTNMVFTFPDVPPSGCTTTLQFTCSGPGADAFVDRDFPVTVIQTQTFTQIRQDPSGFQFGLGISPFGQFGTTRVWAQNATLLSSPTRIRLSASTFCNELPPTTAFNAYSSGARIQNNSWSDGLTINNGGQYNANAQAFDVAVRDALPVGTGQPVPGPSALNQEFIVVFAANSGLCDAGTSGNVGGFGDIRVTSPSTAKNILTVGSSENVRLDGSGCAVPVNQDNSLDIFQDSAFGPTLDGRFKPEIVAPGTSVYGVLTSYGLGVTPQNALQIITQTGPCLGLFNEGFWTETNAFNACVGITNFGQTVRSPAVSEIGELCAGASVEGVQFGQTGLYECRSGSSYAAPAVSGAIQLLWWYFQNRLTNEVGTALFQPSPAMAKAYLLNSARYLPITNPQTGAKDTLPSTAQGMGILDLARMFDGVSRVIRDESAPRAIDTPITTTNPAPQQTFFSRSGQSYELQGVIASNDLPFRVTLAWTDTPGNPSSFLQLVNDLDLEVTVNGTTYKGNVFAEDHSVIGGTFDSVNNVESVFLPAGSVSAGTPYTIKIRAINIAGDGVPNVGGALDQDFALVVYNSQTNFTSLSDVPNLATNNACQTAIEISQFPFTFSNTLSTNVYHNVHPSPSVGEGGADEFFKIALPPAGTLFTIDTAGSTFSNVLSVWRVQVVPQSIFVRSDCGALVEVASDNAGGPTNLLSFVADGSNDYYIVVEPRNGGAGGTMTLNVTRTAPSVTITPLNIDFSNQIVGVSSDPVFVSVKNTGVAPVSVSNVALGGLNPGEFFISTNLCAGASILPGDSCTIGVGFNPSVLGVRNAQLLITTSETNVPHIVALRGTGIAAGPLIAFAADQLVFGDQAVGTTSVVQSVTVTNIGSGNLIISSITPVGGCCSNDFFVSSSTCLGTPIPSNGTCTINIQFTPSGNGPRGSLLQIISNAGTGTNTTLVLLGTGVSPGIGLNTSFLNFGPQPVNITSAPQNVVVQNTGNAPLIITSVTVGGTNQADFVISTNTCLGTPIAPGDACAISVTFRPGALGPRNASLTIAGNATNSPQVVGLTGSGATNVPAIAINPLSLTFPDQLVGTTGAVQQITISNPGTASLTISDTSFVGGNTDSFVIVNNTCQSGVIPPGGNCVIGIASAPKASGPLSTTLRILSNAGNGTNTVPIFGSGIAPAITFIPDPLDFGTNPVGVASLRTLSVMNSGNAQLVIPPGGISLGGASPGDYSITFITCTNAPILPGQSCFIGLQFRPTATLQRNAQLFVVSNATNSPAIATLTGVGVPFTCPTITVSPPLLPNPIIGAAYSNVVTAAGGTEPYTFVVSAGALPPGLSLSLGGLISGTPTTAGTFSFTVLATDTNGCTGTQGYSVTVACPIITVLPATPTLPSATAGAAYNQQLSAVSSGGDTQFVFTVVAGSLPPGLTLTGGGLLSGTPTTVGVFSFTVQAANPQGCVGTQTYSITVNCANVTLLPVTLQNGLVGVAYFQTNSVIGGVPPYSFFLAGGSLPPGLTYSTNGVISGTPTLAGSFNFTAAAQDANGCLASRAYTLVIGCGQLPLLPVTLPDAVVGASYSQTIQVSGRTNGVVFTRTSGTMPPGLTLGTNGVLSGTPARDGLGLSPFSFQVSALDLSNNCTYSRFYTIKVVCPTLGVLPAALPVGSFGDPYSVQLTATGGAAPYVFVQTAGALPAGISLSTNGLLSGTLMSGSSPFTVTVTDSNGCTASVQYTLTVANSCPTITVNPVSLPTAVAGQPYNQTLTASGGTGPYTFSVVLSSLPPGLTLSPAGVLSGTPLATGTVTFTVQALDSSGCKGFRAYTLNVVCDTILVSPVSLPTGTVTVAYSQLLTASNGVAPHTFAVTSSTLPAGLSLSSGGLLSGTTTNAGTFAFTVTATDAAGCSASRLYSLAINPSADLAVAVTDAPDPSAVGSNITYVITVTNRGPSVATSVVLSNIFSAGVTNVVTACSVSGNNIVCALGTLPAGGSVTITNRVSPLTSGLLTNTVAVSSATLDLVPANNTALAVTTVNPAVGFAAATELVNASAGEAVVNVRRLGKADEVVTVQYATSDDTAVAGADYVATSGVLSFDVGVSERSIKVPLIKTGIAGLKTARLHLSNPTGGAVLGPRATAKIDILNSPKAATPLTFNDADGDVVTVRVNGAGKAQVSLLGEGVGPVGQITVVGADAKSTLIVTVKRGATGNGQVDIGGIVAGSLKAINAKSANVTGAGIQLDGVLGNLNVNAIRNSAASAGGGITSVNAKEISGSLITAGFAPSNVSDPMAGGSFVNAALIKSVKAVMFGDSTIAAAQVGAVKLGTVPTDNGGHAFGVLARDAIGSVKIAQPQFTWSASGAADQAKGDFHVKH